MRWALLGPTPGSRPSSSIRSWTAPSYTPPAYGVGAGPAVGATSSTSKPAGPRGRPRSARAARERVPVREQQGPAVLGAASTSASSRPGPAGRRGGSARAGGGRAVPTPRPARLEHHVRPVPRPAHADGPPVADGVAQPRRAASPSSLRRARSATQISRWCSRRATAGSRRAVVQLLVDDRPAEHLRDQRRADQARAGDVRVVRRRLVRHAGITRPPTRGRRPCRARARCPAGRRREVLRRRRPGLRGSPGLVVAAARRPGARRPTTPPPRPG